MLNNLDSSNNFQFSIPAAQVLGLSNAIYCSMLASIQSKAERKRKIYDGYFFVNRPYVTNKTTLTMEEQYECDAALAKVGVVRIDGKNPDKLLFDYERFAQVVTGDDGRFLKEIAKKARRSSPSEVREAKKLKTIEVLQNKVSSGNANVDLALRHWIEVTCEKAFMSPDTVLDFQKVLMQYAGVDVRKALRVVEIATSQAWTSITQAISSYEKEKEVLSKAISQPRVSSIKRGSQSSLSNEVY